MNICGWERYHTAVYEKICAYAFENHEEDPFFSETKLDWNGEIYDVSRIDQELHKDLIEDLKALNMYDNIVSTCDKFVILPDVFSKRALPINMKIREQYDTGRIPVLKINGKMLNIVLNNLNHIAYNHNGYYYCFYNNSNSQNIFNNAGGKLNLVSLRSITCNIKPNLNQLPQIQSGNFVFSVGLDNKVVTTTNVPRVDFRIHRDFFKFTVEDTATPQDEFEELPGNKSAEWHDAWTSPKMKVFILEGEYIHNMNIILSKSALIFMKDGTWKQELLTMEGPGEYLEKIDKHTVKVLKTTDVKEFIVFYTDHRRDSFSMVDSVYYKCLDINPRAFIDLKGSQKNTNNLHHYIKNTKPTLEDLVEYGYKYDADILKIIEDFFRLKWHIDLTDINWTYKFIDGTYAYEPKLQIKALNRMKLRPVVFINGKAFDIPYNIKQRDDMDYIYIDYGALCDLFGINKVSMRDSKPDIIVKVRKQFENLINAIDVIFVKYNNLIDFKTSAILYKEKKIDNFMWDEFGGRKIKGRFYGDYFINGCLTPEIFPDENNLDSVKLLRRVEGLNLFEFGDRNFDHTKTDSTATYADTWKYNTSDFVDGVCIFDNLGRRGLYHRINEPLRGSMRFDLGYDNKTVIDINNFNNITPFPKHFSEYNNVIFDYFGRLVHNSIIYGNRAVWKGMVSSFESNDNNFFYYNIYNLVAENPMYNLDIKIDWDRVEAEMANENVGCYNDNTIHRFREDIIQSVMFGEGSIDGKDSVVKDPDVINKEKIALRYFYSCFGTPHNSSLYTTETAGIDSSLFTNLDKKGLVESLNSTYVQEKKWYEIYSKNAKFINKKEAISIAEDVINNNRKYNIELTDLERHYIGNKLRLDGTINITTKGVD